MNKYSDYKKHERAGLVIYDFPSDMPSAEIRDFAEQLEWEHYDSSTYIARHADNTARLVWYVPIRFENSLRGYLSPYSVILHSIHLDFYYNPGEAVSIVVKTYPSETSGGLINNALVSFFKYGELKAELHHADYSESICHTHILLK